MHENAAANQEHSRSTQFYREIAKELAKKFAPRAAEWDRTRTYCHDNVRDLVDAGIMGMAIPRAYGGREASLEDVLVVIEEIAKAYTLSARIVTEANMGSVGAIMAYGSEEQKRFCASLVLAGDKPAICISEPVAGSAATHMKTTARKEGGLFHQWNQALDYRRRNFEAPPGFCTHN